MAKSKAKIEVDWDKDFEKKFESKIEKWSKSCGKSKASNVITAGSGGLYCIGFIGAAVYYIQIAEGFGAGIIGLLKALIWPGFLVYELMKFLGM